MQQQTEVVKEEGDAPPPEYVVDIEQADSHGRALGMLIAGRRCYESRQADPEIPTSSRAIKKVVKRIADHCNETSDYLLPDTPLKEAVFRVMLAGGNKPVTPEQVSQVLAERWAMTPYPRDISAPVIQKLMDSSQSYCIVRLPGPEPEVEEPEADEEPPIDIPAETASETAEEESE
jgi:hypothetical protein